MAAHTDNAPLAARLSASAVFSWRACAFGLVAIAEIAAATVSFDGDNLPRNSALLALLRQWGPWILRFSICSAGLFVTFAYLARSGKASPTAASNLRAIHPRWAAVHLLSAAAFAYLGSRLYSGMNGAAATALPPMIIAWLTSGAAAAAALVFSFFSVRHCADFVWNSWKSMAAAGVASVPILLAAVPSQSLWLHASRLTFSFVRLLLAGILPVTADIGAMTIQAPHFRVIISPECSGLEGAGLMIVFGSIWLWLFRKECRFPQAFALLPAGIVVMFLLNAVRIALLLLIGNAGARQIAAGGFHSQAGWITFNAVAFSFCAAARRIPLFSLNAGNGNPAQTASRNSAPAAVPYAENPTAVFLLPLLAILAAGMIARAASGTFEWLYPLRFVAALAVLWRFRKAYRALDWRFGWIGLGAGIAVFAVWMLSVALHAGLANTAMPAPLAEAAGWQRISWLAIRAMASATTVPIAEELAFRGYVLRRLIAPQFESVDFRQCSWSAVLISSLAFGLLHGAEWIAGTIAGTAYAMAAMRSRRIGEAVIAHMVTNSLITLSVLGLGKYQLW